MNDILLISVRFYEGWYHGSGSTPSPARMFQALVAGAGLSGPLTQTAVSSLKWLERLPPPMVAVPWTMRGQSVVNYVPNNDLDSRQGDHRRIDKIRIDKPISPLLFDPKIPFLFAWRLDGNDETPEAAKGVCELADHVYQVGRTVDMAWAWGEILSFDELQNRLSSYRGIIRHPSSGAGDVDCPTPGSLETLNRRYAAAAMRFAMTADGKGQTFRQRPKPKWWKVSYAGISAQFLLELRRSDDAGFAPWPLQGASQLVELLRDAAAQKLRATLSRQAAEIDRVLIGRRPTGENSGPTSARVRIVPLPSIGHPQADMQVRRILVHVPGECPILSGDIAWAFSGLRLDHPVLSELIDVIRSSDQSQLKYFGVNEPARVWRSITPVVLSDAARRRIDPDCRQAEVKAGSEKFAEQVNASFAVAQALRHAGVDARLTSLRVQREPFDLRGTRVEPFADGTRFSKHTLWHVELEFESPVAGALMIGNGRFLGLGVMKPVLPKGGVFAFSIESGLNANPDPLRLAQALRRAVMERAQSVVGCAPLPAYFSGHQPDGSFARSEEAPHLAFLFDARQHQLLVIAPEILGRHADKRNDEKSTSHLATLETALEGFSELRAGRDGYLRIRPVLVDSTCHRLFAPSHVWESVTPYEVNRHARRSNAETVLKNDVMVECERRGLPRPEITILEWNAGQRTGLQGKLRLKFKDAIEGPIILGRNRHRGGGVFASPG